VQRLRDQKPEEEESNSGDKQGEQRGRKKGEEEWRRRGRRNRWRRVGEGGFVAPIALEEARGGRKSCGAFDVALVWIRLCLNQINHFIDVEDDAEEELLRRNLDFVLGCSPNLFRIVYVLVFFSIE